MSKCRPQVGISAQAITDFLKSVHVNGKPLELPSKIDSLHVNPRNQLNMMKAIDAKSLEVEAHAADISESLSVDIDERLRRLDARIDEVVRKLK